MTKLLTTLSILLTATASYAQTYTVERVIKEGFPENFSECMRTDEKYDFQSPKRSNLKCAYTVFKRDAKEKYSKCLQMGGSNPSYEIACQLIFYNPTYQFPEGYEDCVKENKGEILISPYKICRINIIPSLAYNKDVATKLLNQCSSKGGHYEEMNFLCPAVISFISTTLSYSPSPLMAPITHTFTNVIYTVWSIWILYRIIKHRTINIMTIFLKRTSYSII